MSDKGSHDFFYSNTYGNTAMQEEIEAARKAALAERQQQEAEIAAAAEPKEPAASISSAPPSTESATLVAPTKPPKNVTGELIELLKPPKPEIKPRTPKVETLPKVEFSPNVEPETPPLPKIYPNLPSDEERAEFERRSKALLIVSGLKVPTDKDLNEIEAMVRQLTEQQTRQVLENLRKAETVDLCFLVDVTASMDPYIPAVAKSVFQIVEEVARAHRARPLVDGKQSFRAAFLGYRDIQPEILKEERTEIVEFSPNVQLFQDKVKAIKAYGGWDVPEDVMGGIEKALTKLEWSPDAGTRIIFHVADNPCHGRLFHCGLLDNFPDGDPFKRDPRVLFGKMREMNIQYFFGRIQSQTDKMIEQFSKLLRDTIEVVNINELPKFQEIVSTVVSTSIRTSITQAATITDKLELRRFEISKMEPEWTHIPTETIEMKTFKKPPNLEAILRDGRLSTQIHQEQVKIGKHPFAQGADRIVYHGILLAPPGVQAAAAVKDKRLMKSAMGTHVVFKQFKLIVPDGEADAFFYEEQAQLQAISAFFAHDFSRLKDLHPPIQLRYVQSKVCKTGDGTMFSVEPEFQEAKMIKFSNNGNYKLKKEEAAKYDIPVEWLDFIMTFSHWTFAITNGQAMVVDLQGGWQVKVGEKLEILLTDPVIHCVDLVRYHLRGNLGKDGMMRFFADHDCNLFCRNLGIENKRI